jgi:hypothetical protein
MSSHAQPADKRAGKREVKSLVRAPEKALQDINANITDKHVISTSRVRKLLAIYGD